MTCGTWAKVNRSGGGLLQQCSRLHTKNDRDPTLRVEEALRFGNMGQESVGRSDEPSRLEFLLSRVLFALVSFSRCMAGARIGPVVSSHDWASRAGSLGPTSGGSCVSGVPLCALPCSH